MPASVWSSLKQTNKPMTHKLLLAGLAVGLLTSAHAQSNPIDSFFQANYNVPNLAEYANRQVGQVSYVLVNWSEYDDVQKRYLDGGYVKLGESGWESSDGAPDKDGAITYARFLGADAVVYTTISSSISSTYVAWSFVVGQVAWALSKTARFFSGIRLLNHTSVTSSLDFDGFF